MKSKIQNPSPEEIRKVARMMQIQMRNNALYHFNHIDARTLIMLQNLDLFEGETRPIGDDVVISLLQKPEHPMRIKLPAGPLILYVTEAEENKRIVIELPVLMLSEIPDVRIAVLECLERMIQNTSLVVTPKTGSILKKLRKALISDDTGKWRLAAVAMYDALNDDVLVALQGIRQSLECVPVIQNSLNFYVPKVFYPTISSLDSITLGFSNPEKEHEQLDKLIGQIVAKAHSLAEVCSDYYEKLGYLPLAPKYSMAEAVHRWIEDHTDTDVWTEIWDWANKAFGPVPKYHVCCVFVLYPELVPQSKLPDLWKEILGIVYNQMKEEGSDDKRELWELRRDLVRHFAYHLESHLPDHNSAKIACFAWWFSEQVAAIFPDNPESARFYREKWIRPASEMSSYIWITASPHIQRSFLRYISLTISSPWAVGLLSIMGDKLEQLAPGEQSDEVRAQFHDALVSNSIYSLPFPVLNPSDPTFALECSLAETMQKWADFQPEEQRKALEQLVKTSQTLGTAEGLCKALRKFGELSLADKVAVALVLKAKAYTDPTIAEGVWEIISDANWRQEVLGNADAQILGILIEAFGILQVDNREKWFSLLPHYIAELCEIADNEEKQNDLFIYVLHTSLASDTVSAVRRLLKGDKKAKFINIVKKYRDRVEAMRSEYPPWVAGKLRGLIANLRVV